jgi:hypothetical protein
MGHPQYSVPYARLHRQQHRHFDALVFPGTPVTVSGLPGPAFRTWKRVSSPDSPHGDEALVTLQD